MSQSIFLLCASEISYEERLPYLQELLDSISQLEPPPKKIFFSIHIHEKCKIKAQEIFDSCDKIEMTILYQDSPKSQFEHFYLIRNYILDLDLDYTTKDMWLLFVDDDDLLATNHISSYRNVIEKLSKHEHFDNIVAITCTGRYENKFGKLWDKVDYPDDYCLDYFMSCVRFKILNDFFAGKSSFLIKKRFCDQHFVRYFKSIEGGIHACFKDYTYFYRTHNFNTTNTIQNEQNLYENIIENFLYMCLPIRNVLDELKISSKEININVLRKYLLNQLQQLSDKDVNKRQILENFYL
jgi:hypothetical protein